MKNIRVKIGLLGVLIACGFTVASAHPTVVIAMYGDSTTYGTTGTSGNYTQSPHNEPVSIQWDMQQNFGSGVVVENHGVPGSTCPQWLHGQGNVTQSWAAEMAASKAQIVTMNCAINDAFITSETSADFEYCYGQFAMIAKQYGKTFVIMGPNPLANSYYNSLLEQRAEQEAYVANLQSVALIDHFDNIENNVPNYPDYLPDGIHPNDALYEYKAQYSYSNLSGVVQFYLTH